ncbi:hypothetical protein [Chromobacterium subtsugae]|uniref:hypothetical protein n=1 Tax=Chromobacterium subtsugae TaxID=251747 RepID=UPI000640FE30|nr:hypothetical protein [Chromobacterium subtsugae]
MINRIDLNILMGAFFATCLFFFSIAIFLTIFIFALLVNILRNYDVFALQFLSFFFFSVSALALGVIFSGFLKECKFYGGVILRLGWYFYILKLLVLIFWGWPAHSGWVMLRGLWGWVGLWVYFPAWILERRRMKWFLGFPLYLLLPDVIFIIILFFQKGIDWSEVFAYLISLGFYSIFFKYIFDLFIHGFHFKSNCFESNIFVVVATVFSVLGGGGLFLFVIFV